MSYLARSSVAVGSAPTPPGAAGASARSATEPRRPAERLPTPGTFQAPVRLALRAQPQPLRYAVTTRWEERRYAEVTRTIVQKELLLSSVAHGSNLRVTWLAVAPTLRKPDLLAFEELVLTLAGIYQRLVIDTSPAGEFLALANHPEIVAAWDRIEQELLARYGEAEELTRALRAAVAAQVQEPALLLGSLAHDYTYHLLVANLYQQRFESGWGYGQARSFPHFLADTGVHFHERLELGDPAAPGRATLLVSGRLDEQRTDRAAVVRQVAAALATISPPTEPPPDPAALTFAYRARYDLDVGTGWPVAVAATITCRSPAGYAKEYDLTVQQL
jgi:hypothetical protein